MPTAPVGRVSDRDKECCANFCMTHLQLQTELLLIDESVHLGNVAVRMLLPIPASPPLLICQGSSGYRLMLQCYSTVQGCKRLQAHLDVLSTRRAGHRPKLMLSSLLVLMGLTTAQLMCADLDACSQSCSSL